MKQSVVPAQIQIMRVRYNLLTGLAWCLFWAFLLFFMGVMWTWWTLESQSAHMWWIASAVLITVRKPFRSISILTITLPDLDKSTDIK